MFCFFIINFCAGCQLINATGHILLALIGVQLQKDYFQFTLSLCDQQNSFSLQYYNTKFQLNNTGFNENSTVTLKVG